MTRKSNGWAERFGARRAAADKLLLEECERQMTETFGERFAAERDRRLTLEDHMRATIAAAFGRPAQFNGDSQ